MRMNSGSIGVIWSNCLENWRERKFIVGDNRVYEFKIAEWLSEGNLQCVVVHGRGKDGELKTWKRKYSAGAGYSILVAGEVSRTRAGLGLEQKAEADSEILSERGKVGQCP